MAVQHSTVPATLIKLHNITYKLDQDPMRVSSKVAFIIVLTDTICMAQKDCMEMNIIYQILALRSSDYKLIEQTYICPSWNKQKGPRVLYFHFRSNNRE